MYWREFTVLRQWCKCDSCKCMKFKGCDNLNTVILWRLVTSLIHKWTTAIHPSNHMQLYLLCAWYNHRQTLTSMRTFVPCITCTYQIVAEATVLKNHHLVKFTLLVCITYRGIRPLYIVCLREEWFGITHESPVARLRHFPTTSSSALPGCAVMQTLATQCIWVWHCP